MSYASTCATCWIRFEFEDVPSKRFSLNSARCPLSINNSFSFFRVSAILVLLFGEGPQINTAIGKVLALVRAAFLLLSTSSKYSFASAVNDIVLRLFDIYHLENCI